MLSPSSYVLRPMTPFTSQTYRNFSELEVYKPFGKLYVEIIPPYGGLRQGEISVFVVE
jgi:hypothetical protein